jgi:hypothetical protein
MRRFVTACVFVCLVVSARTEDAYPSNYVAASLVRLNDNGAWSWFMDPRGIVNDELFRGERSAAGKWTLIPRDDFHR